MGNDEENLGDNMEQNEKAQAEVKEEVGNGFLHIYCIFWYCPLGEPGSNSVQIGLRLSAGAGKQ